MKTLILVIVLGGWTAPALAGNVSSMGNGQTGPIQQITQINNAAEEFNAAANQWMKDWPTEKVRRNGTDASSGTIAYCLGGSKTGNDLVVNGDNIAHQYDAFMAANPTASDNVRGPASAEDAILHSAYAQYKANQKAANCGNDKK